MLHWILIPVETVSFLLLLTVAVSITCSRFGQKYRYGRRSLESWVMNAIGWTTGLVSLAITSGVDNDKVSIGTASLVFHLAAVAVCDKLVREQGAWKAMVIAACSWTIAGSLQVGMGHWMLEDNQPSVANLNEVSWLAMTQSVLISWSS
jgi:phage-related holin